MIKIGMLSFAHMHAWSYADSLKKLPDAELSGIYDPVEERGKKMAVEFETDFYRDCEELLDTDIAAVIICSENALHKEYTIKAAKTKKHVLCEKPIATTIEDADAMINVCKKNDVKLQTAFPCRFLTPVVRGKVIVDERKLGEILAIKGTNRGSNPGDWFLDKKLAGGGAVMDHTVHVADLMRWFLKSEVKEVYAEVGNRFLKMDIDDCGIITLEFENGVFGTIDPSWSRNKAYPTWGDVTMDITGTEGFLSIDAFNQKIDVYNDDRMKPQEFCWTDNMDYYLIKDFVSAIKEDQPVSITGEDGREALRIALTAYQSADEKKPVILR